MPLVLACASCKLDINGEVSGIGFRASGVLVHELRHVPYHLACLDSVPCLVGTRACAVPFEPSRNSDVNMLYSSGMDISDLFSADDSDDSDSDGDGDSDSDSDSKAAAICAWERFLADSSRATDILASTWRQQVSKTP